MEPTPAIRVDRWLWSVRLYRTRTLASNACQAGHVQVNGQRCKPSRAVRAGDVITARAGDIIRTVRVIAVLDRRVGAGLVAQYLEDRTPSAEKEKTVAPVGQRPRGTGRPTKKQRRVLSSFFGLDQ
jgi:ribosome-associated heat shock protein Hsp15